MHVYMIIPDCLSHILSLGHMLMCAIFLCHTRSCYHFWSTGNSWQEAACGRRCEGWDHEPGFIQIQQGWWRRIQRWWLPWQTFSGRASEGRARRTPYAWRQRRVPSQRWPSTRRVKLRRSRWELLQRRKRRRINVQIWVSCGFVSVLCGGYCKWSEVLHTNMVLFSAQLVLACHPFSSILSGLNKRHSRKEKLFYDLTVKNKQTFVCSLSPIFFSVQSGKGWSVLVLFLPSPHRGLFAATSFTLSSQLIKLHWNVGNNQTGNMQTQHVTAKASCAVIVFTTLHVALCVQWSSITPSHAERRLPT